MPVRLGSIASGLPPNIVDQLVEAEKIPLKNMEDKKGKQQARLDLVTDLETRLNKVRDSLKELASTRGFKDFKIESGNPNIVGGVADPETLGSAKGNYNVEVMELAQRAAAISNGFPDKDRTEVGVGYFTFETNEGEKEVYINGDNNTLQGVADTINSAQMGVRASVINDRQDADRPFKLMVSADSVGGDNTVRYPTLYFLDGDQDFFFDETREAKNGRIKVDGIEFEVASNSVENVIPGVTLDLKQASPGRQVSISVKEDLEVVSGKIKEFVDSMNGVLSFIQQQNRMDANTDTSRTLGGDSLLRTVEARLRRLIQSPQMGIDGPVRRLSQVGIEFSRAGVLQFEEKVFNDTLVKNPEAVQEFFTGDSFNTGFIPSVRRTVGTILDSAFGPVALRKRTLRQKIDRIDDRIANKERQIAKKEQSLRRKFANLEEKMAQLKSQGGALQAMGAGGGGLMQLLG